jgi:hypothetical protein
MLHVIKHLEDPLLALVKDDPVRPEIELSFRVSDSSEVFVLLEEQPDAVSPRAAAVVCCAYRNMVPATVEELRLTPATTPSTAVFYTIWSYSPGAGRRLIREARSWIETNRQGVGQFVTLSPPTEMARVFHIRNGASVLRINGDTVNYLYA